MKEVLNCAVLNCDAAIGRTHDGNFQQLCSFSPENLVNAPHHHPIHLLPSQHPLPDPLFPYSSRYPLSFLNFLPLASPISPPSFFSVLSSRPSRDALLRTGFLDLYHGCLVLHLIVECVTLESALMIPFKRTKRKKEEKQEQTGSGGSRI